MTQQKIRPDLIDDEAHYGIVMLELLAAWSCGNDVPISDEDADWLDEQIELGMLNREVLPPDVHQQVMQIYESVELTNQLIKKL